MKRTAKATVAADAKPTVTLSEAQRLAATILEVLAGVRSPPEAAQGLGISLPRYYQLEARAVEGLVAALGPRPRGKQPLLENRINQLEKQLDVAQRQCARQEALVRVTQRSLGLAMLVKPESAPTAGSGKGRKKRKPMVRSLRAADRLRAQADSGNAGNPELPSLQPIAPSAGAEEAR